MKLREATQTHVAQIDALFGEHFDEPELARLGELLTRIADPNVRGCELED